MSSGVRHPDCTIFSDKFIMPTNVNDDAVCDDGIVPFMTLQSSITKFLTTHICPHLGTSKDKVSQS